MLDGAGSTIWIIAGAGCDNINGLSLLPCAAEALCAGFVPTARGVIFS